jgi:4-diphosphocytidyl-2-C-methyl-D-erythritol kinase
MNALLHVPAPAKLNLFLHITGRRADGYHCIQSVFQLIDWCDSLHFHVRPDGIISRTDTGTHLRLPQDDLCVKAARLLQQHTGCPLGVDITLDKRIPAQAGLGGGSSDAASCLLALNRLWDLKVPRSELLQLGTQLGADVPFFVGGAGASWVEGIGDELHPIGLPETHYLVVKPEAGVETASIFKHTDLQRDMNPATISVFAEHIQHQAAARFGSNVLQPVAELLCPEITTALQWLSEKGLQARMTGSGSAVFAECASSAVPTEWLAGQTGKVCRTLAQHPLAGW